MRVPATRFRFATRCVAALLLEQSRRSLLFGRLTKARPLFPIQTLFAPLPSHGAAGVAWVRARPEHEPRHQRRPGGWRRLAKPAPGAGPRHPTDRFSRCHGVSSQTVFLDIALVRRYPKRRIPRSNSVSGGRNESLCAIAPNAVFLAVATTRHRALSSPDAAPIYLTEQTRERLPSRHHAGPSQAASPSTWPLPGIDHLLPSFPPASCVLGPAAESQRPACVTTTVLSRTLMVPARAVAPSLGATLNDTGLSPDLGMPVVIVIQGTSDCAVQTQRSWVAPPQVIGSLCWSTSKVPEAALAVKLNAVRLTP